MKNLLITGFDAFGGDAINPSWLAVEQLPERIGEYVLCKLQIPTVYGLAAERVLEQAAVLRPDVILCVGVAAGRPAVTPERIGVNIRDARIADNGGNRPRGELAVSDGPAAYFATVDVVAMAEAIDRQGIPAAVSNSAGTFVCNDVLYTLLHRLAGTPTRVGFLHVPCLPEQGSPGLPLDTLIQSLTAAIQSL